MGIRNAFRRKGGSISTILQVAFGVGVVIAMLNGGDGFIDMTVRAYDPQTWDLRTTVADNPSDPMTVDKAARIKGVEGVKSAEPVYRTVPTIDDRTEPPRSGCSGASEPSPPRPDRRRSLAGDPARGVCAD